MLSICNINIKILHIFPFPLEVWELSNKVTWDKLWKIRTIKCKSKAELSRKACLLLPTWPKDQGGHKAGEAFVIFAKVPFLVQIWNSLEACYLRLVPKMTQEFWWVGNPQARRFPGSQILLVFPVLSLPAWIRPDGHTSRTTFPLHLAPFNSSHVHLGAGWTLKTRNKHVPEILNAKGDCENMAPRRSHS